MSGVTGVLLTAASLVAAESSTSLPPVPPEPQGAQVPAVFRKSNPQSLADLRAMEQQVQTLLPRLMAAVVAIDAGGSSGSGVVISPDGYVLTAGHVITRPGREVGLVFEDGTTARAKSLGVDVGADAGLIKITKPGPWPYVEMGDLKSTRVGEWVLTVGHPGGYDAQRGAVVRFGRVVRLSTPMLQTDCTITAGDSGGPLFDMRGLVVGIHSRINEAAAENYHVPITVFRDDWSRLVRGERWGEEESAPVSTLGVRGADHADGCEILSLIEAGPAEKAGLQVGDIVRRIGDLAITNHAVLKQRVREAKPGQELKLTVQRDGKELVLSATVGVRGGGR